MEPATEKGVRQETGCGAEPARRSGASSSADAPAWAADGLPAASEAPSLLGRAPGPLCAGLAPCGGSGADADTVPLCGRGWGPGRRPDPQPAGRAEAGREAGEQGGWGPGRGGGARGSLSTACAAAPAASRRPSPRPPPLPAGAHAASPLSPAPPRHPQGVVTGGTSGCRPCSPPPAGDPQQGPAPPAQLCAGAAAVVRLRRGRSSPGPGRWQVPGDFTVKAEAGRRLPRTPAGTPKSWERVSATSRFLPATPGMHARECA